MTNCYGVSKALSTRVAPAQMDRCCEHKGVPFSDPKGSHLTITSCGWLRNPLARWFTTREQRGPSHPPPSDTSSGASIGLTGVLVPYGEPCQEIPLHFAGLTLPDTVGLLEVSRTKKNVDKTFDKQYAQGLGPNPPL